MPAPRPKCLHFTSMQGGEAAPKPRPAVDHPLFPPVHIAEEIMRASLRCTFTARARKPSAFSTGTTEASSTVGSPRCGSSRNLGAQVAPLPLVLQVEAFHLHIALGGVGTPLHIPFPLQGSSTGLPASADSTMAAQVRTTSSPSSPEAQGSLSSRTHSTKWRMASATNPTGLP